MSAGILFPAMPGERAHLNVLSVHIEQSWLLSWILFPCPSFGVPDFLFSWVFISCTIVLIFVGWWVQAYCFQQCQWRESIWVPYHLCLHWACWLFCWILFPCPSFGLSGLFFRWVCTSWTIVLIFLDHECRYILFQQHQIEPIWVTVHLCLYSTKQIAKLNPFPLSFIQPVGLFVR